MTKSSAFSLFEVLIALAVFALAALGIGQAISGSVDAAMAARDRSLFRTALESRLAYCQAFPPKPGEVRRVEGTAPGLRIEETLELHSAENAKGKPVENLFRLTLTASREGGRDQEKISILLLQPARKGGKSQ